MVILFIGYHNALNKTIISILDGEEDFTIEYCSPNVVESRLPELQQQNFNLVIADLSGFARKPVKTVEYLKKLTLGQHLLVIHFYQSTYLIKPLLDAGANGYLSTITSGDEIFAAISCITSGEIYPAI